MLFRCKGNYTHTSFIDNNSCLIRTRSFWFCFSCVFSVFLCHNSVSLLWLLFFPIRCITICLHLFCHIFQIAIKFFHILGQICVWTWTRLNFMFFNLICRYSSNLTTLWEVYKIIIFNFRFCWDHRRIDFLILDDQALSWICFG
ncbi:hypothetical protein D3C72_2066400 [compost metagenome]